MAGPKTLSLSTGAVTNGNSSSLPVVTGQGNTQTQTSQNYLASLGISLPTNTAQSNLNTGLVGAGQQTTNILDQAAINAKYQDTGTYTSKSDQALITRQNLLQNGVSAQKQAIEKYYNDLILDQYSDPNRDARSIRFNESSTDKIVNRIYNQINNEQYNEAYDTGYTSAYGKYYNGDYKLGRELAQQAGGAAHDWGTGFVKGIDALVDMFQDTVLGGDTGIDGWDILTRKYEGYTSGMNIAQQKDVETASWQYGANVANQIVFSGVQNILDTASTVLLMGTGGLITGGIAGAMEGAKAALGTSAINALLGRATDTSLNIMALRVLGDSYSEMTQNSPFAKTSEAFAHAAISAATEYYSEKMSGWGAIGAQGSATSGIIDSIWETIATSVFGTTGVGGVMSTLAMGFMGESFEEIVSQCAGDIVNEAFYRANGLTGSMEKSTLEDYLTAGLVGGLSGAIGGASHLVFNYAQQASMFQQFKEKVKALAGIVDDPVVEQAQTEEAQRLTEEARKQIEVQRAQQAQIAFAEGARRGMQQAAELANIGLSYKAFWEALNKQYSEVDPKQATSLFERLMKDKADAETIKTQMDNQARATLDNLQSEMGQERVDAAELQKLYDQLGLAGANHIITKGVENIGKGANNAAVTALTGQMKAEESMPRGTRAEQLRAKQDEAFLETQRQNRAKEKQARLKEALKIKHGEKLPAYQRDVQKRKEAKAAEAKAKEEAKRKAEAEKKAAEAKAKAEYDSNFNENNDFRTLSDAGDHSMTLGANIAKQPSGWLIDIYTGKQTSDKVSKESAARELQRRLNYERSTGKRSVNPSVAPVAPVAQNTDVAPVAPVAKEAEVAQPAPAPTIQEADTAMDSTLPVGPAVTEETTPVTPVEEAPVTPVEEAPVTPVEETAPALPVGEPKLAEWEQPLTEQEKAEAEARATAIEEAEAKADAYKSFTTAKEFKDFITNNNVSDERIAEIIEFAYSVLKGGQKSAFTRFLNQRYGTNVVESIVSKLRANEEKRNANIQRALKEQVAQAEAYNREQEALKNAEEAEKLACAVPSEPVTSTLSTKTDEEVSTENEQEETPKVEVDNTSKYESAYLAYKDEFTRLNGGEEIDAETHKALMNILQVIDSGEFNTKNDDFYNYIIPACDEAWLDAHLVRTVADYMLGKQDGIQAMAYGKSEEQKLYEQYKEEQIRMGESYVDLDTYRRTILPRVKQQQKVEQTVKNAVNNGQTVTEQMQKKLAEDAAWSLAKPYETSAEKVKERAESPFVKLLVDVATKNGYKFYVYPAHISKAITDHVGIKQAFGLTVHPHHGIGLDIESATSVAKNFYENRTGYKKAYDSVEEAIQAKIDNVIGHECIHAIMGRTIKAVTEGKGTQQQKSAVQKLDMLFKQALNVYQAQNPNSTETPYAFTNLEEFVSELANDRMRAWLFTNVKNAQGIITSAYKNAATEAGIKVDDTGFSALLSISDVLAYENSARSISQVMQANKIEFPTSLFMSSSRMFGWEVKIQFSQIQKALRGAEEEKKDAEVERKIEEKWSNDKSKEQQTKLNNAATASTATKATSGMFRNLDSPFASQSVEGLKLSQTNSLTGYELYYATARTKGGNNIEYYVFDPSKKQTINGKEQGTCIAKITPSDDAYGTALSILKGNTEYHYVANLVVDPQALTGLQPVVVETSNKFKYHGQQVAYPKAYAPSDVATIAYKIQEYMSTQVNKGRGDIDTIYKEAIDSVKKENPASFAKYEAFTNAGIVDFDAIKALNPNAFEIELTTDYDNGDIATINNTWDNFEGDHVRTNRTPLIVKFKESTSLKERKNFEATVYAMIDRIAQSGITIQGEHYTITRATANDLKHKKLRMTSSELVGDFGAPTQLRETVAALEEKVNAGTATAEEIANYRQLMTRLKLNGGLNNEQIRKPGSKTWTNAGVGQTGSESYASVSRREVKLKNRQIKKNEKRKQEGKVELPITGRIFKGQGKLGECIVVRDIFQQFSERLMSVDGKNGRVGSYEGTISGNWKEAQDGMGLTDGSTFQMRSNVMGHKGVLCSATNWQNAIMEHGAKTLASLSKDLGAQVTTLYSDEYGRVYTNLDLAQLKAEGAEVFPMMGEDPNGSGQIGLYDRWGTWMSLTKNQFTGMDVHHLLTDSMVKFAGSYGNKAAGISGTQDYYRWCGNEDIRIIPKENIYGSGFQDQIDPDADVTAGEEELRSKRKLAIRQMLRGMEVDETDLEHIMANTREYCQQIRDNLDMQRALLKGTDPIVDRLLDKFPALVDTTFAQQKIDNKINRIIAMASFSTVQTETVDRQYSWILADPINIISYLSGEVTGIGIASEEDAKQQLGDIAEMPKNYHGTSVAKYGLLNTENYYADDATYEQGYDTNKVVAPNMREGGSVITRSPMTSKHDARAVINDKSGIMPAMKNYSSKNKRMEIDRDILYVKLNSSIMQRLDNDFDGDTSTMMQDAAIVATILKNTCLARKNGYDEVTSFPHGKAAKTDTTYNSLLFSLKACMTDAGVGMYDVMLDRVYNSSYLTEAMQEEFAATAAAGYILATDYTKTGYMPKAFLDYMGEVKSYLNARVTKKDGKTYIIRESVEGTKVYEYNENGWILTDLEYDTDNSLFKSLPKVAGNPDYYHYGKYNKQDTFKKEKGIQFSEDKKDIDWMNPERSVNTIYKSKENLTKSNKRNFSSRAYEYALGIGEYDSKQNKRSLMYEPTTEEGKTTADNVIKKNKAMATSDGIINFSKNLTATAKSIIEGLFIGKKTFETSQEALRAAEAHEKDLTVLAKAFDTLANPYAESEEVTEYYKKFAKRGRFNKSNKVFAEIGDTYVAEPLGVSNPKKLSKKDYEYYSNFLKPAFDMLYKYTGNTADAINALTYFLMRSTNSFANISYSYLGDYIATCQDNNKVYDFVDFMEQMYAIDQTPEEVKQTSVGFADNQYAETSKGEPMMDTMNDLDVQAYESWEDDFESDMGDSTSEMSGRMYGVDEAELDDADFVTSAIVGQNTPVDEDILNAMDEATDNGMPTQDISFEDSLPVMTMEEAMKAGFVTAEESNTVNVDKADIERQLKQTGRITYPSEDVDVIEAYNKAAEELGWETVGQPFKTGFKNNAKLNQTFAWSESKRDDVMKNLPTTNDIEDDEGVGEAEFATQNVREPNRNMPRTEIPIEEGEESASTLESNISEKINLRDWAKIQLKDFTGRKLKVDYKNSDGENSTQMYYERCMKYIDDVVKGKSPENLWRLWVDGWSQHSDPLFDNSSEIISQMTKICDLYNEIYKTNAKDSEFSQYQYRVKAAVEAITAHVERFDETQERVKKMSEELDTGMKNNKYRKFFSKEKNWLMNKVTKHFTKSMSPGPLLRILGMEDKNSELYKFGDEIEAAGLQQDEMNAIFNRRLSGLMEAFNLDPYHQKTKFIKQLEEKLTADSGLYGLSAGKIINLYNTLQDDAGFQHLVSSGFEAVDKEGNKYIQKIGMKKDQVRIEDFRTSVRDYVNSDTQLKAIAKMCRETLNEYSKYVEKYRRETLGVKASEAVIKENYWMLRVGMSQDDRTMTQDENVKLLDEYLSTRSRNVTNDGPIMAIDALESLNQYCTQMARICSFGPIKMALHQMSAIGKNTGGVYNFKDRLQKLGFNDVAAYIQDFSDELSGTKTSSTDGINGILKNFANAALTGGITVAMKQKASFWNALAEVPMKYLGKYWGLTSLSTEKFLSDSRIKAISKYTGFIDARRGDVDYVTSLRGDVKRGMGEEANLGALGKWINDRTPDVLKGMIPGSDVQTVCRLAWATWDMVKDQNEQWRNMTDTALENEPAFLEAVAKKYSSIGSKTQPMYNVAFRSMTQRSTGIERAVLMFRTQQNRNLNEIMEGIAESEFNGDKTKLNGAIAGLSLASAEYAVLTVLGTLFKGNIDTLDDDDDGIDLWDIASEVLSQAGMSAVATDWIADAVGDVLMAGLGDGKYYGIEVNGVAQASDLATSIVSAMQGVKKGNWSRAGKNAWKALQAAMMITGIPLQNAWNTVAAPFRTAFSIAEMAQLEQEVVKAAQAEGVDASGLLQNGSNLNVSGTGDIVAQAQAKVAQNASYVDRAEALMAEAGIKSNDENYSAIRTQVVSMLKEQDSQKASVTGLSTGNALIDNALEDVATDEYYKQAADALLAQNGMTSANTENYAAIRSSVIKGLKEMDETPKTSPTLTGNSLVDESISDYNTTLYYSQAADALLGAYGMTKDNTADYSTLKSQVISNLKQMDNDYNNYVAKGMDKIFPNVDSWKEFKETADADSSGTVTQDEVNEYVAQHPEAKDYMTAYWNATWTTTKKKNF